jgi:hypothetical protein
LDIGVENAGSGPRDGQFSQGSARPGLAEVYVVWALLGAWGLIDVVTYSRIRPEDLYHVSQSGLAGGLGRALVFLNFPAALAAIAIVLLLADRTGWSWEHALAIALCAVIVVPGVVDQADLDAKWINVVPALGIAIAIALTLRAGRGGWGEPRGDPIRIAVASILAILALPWIFALAGFYFPGSNVIYKGEARVHLGEHHGLEGYLLVLTALLLSRQLPRMRRPIPLAVYLSLMIAYGLGNMANDAWYEQLVKRGWIDWRIPGVMRPSLTWMWLFVIAVGLAVFFTALKPRRDHAATHRQSSTP